MHRWMQFQSKSTMNMNAAVQALQKFNAKKIGHAFSNANIENAALNGIKIVNYITLIDSCMECSWSFIHSGL